MTTSADKIETASKDVLLAVFALLRFTLKTLAKPVHLHSDASSDQQGKNVIPSPVKICQSGCNVRLKMEREFRS